jgi:hypothetical protein
MSIPKKRFFKFVASLLVITITGGYLFYLNSTKTSLENEKKLEEKITTSALEEVIKTWRGIKEKRDNWVDGAQKYEECGGCDNNLENTLGAQENNIGEEFLMIKTDINNKDSFEIPAITLWVTMIKNYEEYGSDLKRLEKKRSEAVVCMILPKEVTKKLKSYRGDLNWYGDYLLYPNNKKSADLLLVKKNNSDHPDYIAEKSPHDPIK